MITAVCDADPQATEWFAACADGETGVHGLPGTAGAPDVDAVYCAVPHNLHRQMYVDIIRAGKHLLGEKPFGIDMEANAGDPAGGARNIRESSCAVRRNSVFSRGAADDAVGDRATIRQNH